MENIKTNSNKKIWVERIIIIFLALLVLSLLIFFIKDIFFEFIRLEIKNDTEAAKALLIDKGFLGYSTISLVEALQMVVIFIPAEFIQITSGMTYPWYLALLLCDLGVVLGATIIYLLVHLFKFNGDIFNKSKKIEKYDHFDSSTKSTMILMYFLFVMPIIPFGAICYFASNRKIKYRYYILTCATGVIPSIITSNLMGRAIKEFISNDIPIWLLIIIIVLLASLLFIGIVFILDKFYFKVNYNTPYSPLYSSFMDFSESKLQKYTNVKITGKDVRQIECPYLIVSNHSCFNDFYFVHKINPERHYSFICNRYYFGMPIIGKLARRAGMIPKRIFSPDSETIRQSYKALKNGYSIAIFPEGILSDFGTLKTINPSISRFAKKLDIPVVIAVNHGAHLLKPKWRKKKFRSDVVIEVKEIITKEDLANLTSSEVYQIINDNLQYDAYLDAKERIYNENKKALGLENIMYRCPKCHELYSLKTKNNQVYCQSCGLELNIDSHYQFDNKEISNVSSYYNYLTKYEENNLDSVNITIPVKTIIFGQNKNKKERDYGIFHLDKDGVTYTSNKTNKVIKLTIDELEGIAYSAGLEFEFYYENRLHYFYPLENKSICAQIALVYDLLRKNNR